MAATLFTKLSNVVCMYICDVSSFLSAIADKGNINREGIRKMTPREWARLQGFPDTFKLPLADVHLYKQMGNSVTVNVIRAIAKKIKEVLDNV